MDTGGDSEAVDLGEDTLSIINTEIDALKNEVNDSAAIKELIRELYTECMANESGRE